MSQLLFVNGQIRALESKLLSVSKLDRMIGATTPDDAFRVMAELQYSEYFDDNVTAKDFIKVIEQGLSETKDLLQKGTGGHKGLNFIFGRFDINNLKRAYKARVIDNEETLTDFTEDNGYSALGNISEQEISSIVFGKQLIENVPVAYLEAITEIESSYVEDKNVQEIEYALDTAYLKDILTVAHTSRDTFLQQLATRSVDMANVRVGARSILSQKKAIPFQAMVDDGSFAGTDWTKIDSVDSLKTLIRRSDFYLAADAMDQKDTAIEQLAVLEESLDNSLKQFLDESAQGQIDSLSVSIAYFERRLSDARRLKFIMFAKFNGFDTDTIYNALGTL